MMHNGDVSLYPKAGLFRLGRTLYNVRNVSISDSQWYGFLLGGPKIVWTMPSWSVVPVDGDCVWILLRVYFAQNEPGIIHLRPTIKGVFPAIHVWRIQRVIRRFLRRCFERRALAMVMGLHERLGQECVFASLSEDLVALCVE
jgi:hypothetical protein